VDLLNRGGPWHREDVYLGIALELQEASTQFFRVQLACIYRSFTSGTKSSAAGESRRFVAPKALVEFLLPVRLESAQFTP